MKDVAIPSRDMASWDLLKILQNFGLPLLPFILFFAYKYRSMIPSQLKPFHILDPLVTTLPPPSGRVYFEDTPANRQLIEGSKNKAYAGAITWAVVLHLGSTFLEEVFKYYLGNIGIFALSLSEALMYKENIFSFFRRWLVHYLLSKKDNKKTIHQKWRDHVTANTTMVVLHYVAGSKLGVHVPDLAAVVPYLISSCLAWPTMKGVLLGSLATSITSFLAYFIPPEPVQPPVNPLVWVSKEGMETRQWLMAQKVRSPEHTEEIDRVLGLLDQGTPDPLYEKWLSSVKHLQHLEEEWPKILPITCEQAYVPAVTAPTGTDPDAPTAAVGMFLLLNPATTMVRPNGIRMFEYAYTQRNISNSHAGALLLTTQICEGNPSCTFYDPPQACPLGARWFQATSRFIAITQLHKCDPNQLEGPRITLSEWARHYGTSMKRARAIQGIHDRANSPIKTTTELFLKGDEVLWPRPEGIKPRTIKALNPTVQAHCARPIYTIFENFKIYISTNLFRYKDCIIRLTVGSGKNSEELSTWMKLSLEEAALHPHYFSGIFAGDDFLGIYAVNGRIIIMENDFSKFDRTEGVHALISEFRVLTIMGCPFDVLVYLSESFSATPKYKNRKLEIKYSCPMPVQRATGGPDTTCGNSFVNMISVVDSLVESHFENLEQDQRQLGLLPKLKIFHDIGSATFLKGWWVNGKWLPLPSQVLKLGKLLTNPTVIFKKTSKLTAWAKIAKAMALGVGSVPDTYPILGPLLKRYKTLTTLDVEAYREREHKVFIDPTPFEEDDREQAISMIMQRYLCERVDIVQLEIIYETAPFPSVIFHPLLKRLGDTDYG